MRSLATNVRKRIARIALGVSIVLGAREARAEDERPIVHALLARGDASALDACGGERAVIDAVERRLRRSTFAPPEAADIWFSLEVGADAAVITEHDRAGTELGRRAVPLPAGDCEKTIDTLGVVIAILIGPEVRTTTAPPPAATTGDTAASAEPERPAPRPARMRAPPKPRPRPPPAGTWTVSPLVEVGVGSGILPGVGWGIGAGAIVVAPNPRLFGIARAAYWPERPTASVPVADVDRIAASLVACGELIRSGRAAVALCGGADVGRIEARSSDFTREARRSVVVGVLGEARFGYRLRVRDKVVLMPVIAGQIEALLKRDRFTYRTPGGRERTLLQPAPVAVQATIGIAVHFP